MNKEETKKYRHERYLAHKAEENQNSRDYYRAHKEHLQVWAHDYRKKYDSVPEHKEHKRILMKEYRQLKKDQITKVETEWRRRHPDILYQMAKQWREKNPEKVEEHNRRYHEEHLEETKARNLAWQNVKVDRCFVCDTAKNVRRHHPDYSKPLEVIPLCQLHHSQLHWNKITIEQEVGEMK